MSFQKIEEIDLRFVMNLKTRFSSHKTVQNLHKIQVNQMYSGERRPRLLRITSKVVLRQQQPVKKRQRRIKNVSELLGYTNTESEYEMTTEDDVGPSRMISNLLDQTIQSQDARKTLSFLKYSKNSGSISRPPPSLSILKPLRRKQQNYTKKDDRSFFFRVKNLKPNQKSPSKDLSVNTSINDTSCNNPLGSLFLQELFANSSRKSPKHKSRTTSRKRKGVQYKVGAPPRIKVRGKLLKQMECLSTTDRLQRKHFSSKNISRNCNDLNTLNDPSLKSNKQQSFMSHLINEIENLGTASINATGINHFKPYSPHSKNRFFGSSSKINTDLIEKNVLEKDGMVLNQLSLSRVGSLNLDSSRIASNLSDRQSSLLIKSIKASQKDPRIYKKIKTLDLHKKYFKPVEIHKKIVESSVIMEEEDMMTPRIPPIMESNVVFKSFEDISEDNPRMQARVVVTCPVDEEAPSIKGDWEISESLGLVTPRLLPQPEIYSRLISAIYDQDVQQAKLCVEDLEQGLLNKKDSNGYTPLILATKLSHQNTQTYLEIINCLLERGSNPLIKDMEGWTAFEESVSLVSVKIASLLFDYIGVFKMQKIYSQISTLKASMRHIPDCYLEIKYDFDSSVIPLVSSFAPSDTLKIWKKGNSVRLDSTLAGYKKLRSKRRELSLLYNPTNGPESDHYQHVLEDPFKVFTVNRSKGIFYRPLEDTDLEEKKAILYDIFNSMPVQGDFKVRKSTLQRAKGIFGGKVTGRVCGYKTEKYQLQLEMDYFLTRKPKALFSISKDKYLDALKSQNRGLISSTKKDRRRDQPEASETEEDVNLFRLNKKQYKLSLKKQQTKSQTVGIHFTRDHQFTLKELMPIIELLSTSNPMLGRVAEILNKEISGDLSENGFPVKIQVPLSMSLRANLYVQKFERLADGEDGPSSLPPQFFNLPECCRRESRKEAQKILDRKRKRMLLANMILQAYNS